MKYKFLEKPKYYVILDTEHDKIVLVSTNRVLCLKMMELYNGNPSTGNDHTP